MSKDSKDKPKRDLRDAVRDPGFSPSVRHVAELAALAADPDLADDVERALARLGPALAPAIAPVVDSAPAAAKPRLLRALGRVADSSEASLAILRAALGDAEPRVRRAAATALGKIALRASADQKGIIEDALVGAWPAIASDAELSALSEALGKVGGERARALLDQAQSDSEHVSRVLTRARLVADRTERRHEPGAIRGDVTPRAPLAVTFFCRRGLEAMLADELGPAFSPRVGAARVFGTLRGPLSSAWAARTAERFAIVMPAAPAKENVPLDVAVTDALLAAEPILSELTEGPVRFRVSWQEGGHKRAVIWKIAEHVAARSRALVNDPSASQWDIEVETRSRQLVLSMRPRGLPDPRFTYRKRDVPGSSHPTIAAALARAAGADETDVVWDPFVGSGLELIERAKLGAFRRLVGCDIDEAALDAARENLAAAGVVAELKRADALSFYPEGASLIVTNPPMGRRVHRKSDIGELLVRFVEHASRHLPPGGRLVWLSPQPDATSEAARRGKLRLEARGSVDLGGFSAELQILTRGR